MTGIATVELRTAMVNCYFSRTLPIHNEVLLTVCARVPAVNAAVSQLTEPSGMGYGRVTVPLNATHWAVDPDGSVSLQTTHSFPEATAGWGYREGWAILSASSSGGYTPRVLATGRLLQPVKVAAGDVLQVGPGDISFVFLDSA